MCYGPLNYVLMCSQLLEHGLGLLGKPCINKTYHAFYLMGSVEMNAFFLLFNVHFWSCLVLIPLLRGWKSYEIKKCRPSWVSVNISTVPTREKHLFPFHLSELEVSMFVPKYYLGSASLLAVVCLIRKFNFVIFIFYIMLLKVNVLMLL